ncbi:hypothetical protein BDV37DRAFT_266190 [Aspergillus pseudonomiae]|uniref:Uncharacterized protein n=1 Tax=Aspergillus pseudonomiae TaxID=1506151 RepID=A0A5N7CSU9_9EURO|nr:uncharacterized protein BDV37DRAFT_266190 [Aspergillus pseudonomiae]KAE8397225.1 hypothetical protein BDV37DRAFT_266190 [Aspergillus pseudonomiae]
MGQHRSVIDATWGPIELLARTDRPATFFLFYFYLILIFIISYYFLSFSSAPAMSFTFSARNDSTSLACWVPNWGCLPCLGPWELWNPILAWWNGTT